MAKYTDVTEFNEAIAEMEDARSEDPNIKYRFVLLNANGSERRVFSRKVGDKMIHADYIYSPPENLTAAVEQLGEDEVFKLFLESLSTKSDDERCRPERVGRKSKRDIEAMAFWNLRGMLPMDELETMAEKTGCLEEFRALKHAEKNAN